MCITHRECSNYLPCSVDRLRVARLLQPESISIDGSRAARQLQAELKAWSRATTSKFNSIVSSSLDLRAAACKRLHPANTSLLHRRRVAHPGQTECCPGYLSLICDNVADSARQVSRYRWVVGCRSGGEKNQTINTTLKYHIPIPLFQNQK